MKYAIIENNKCTFIDDNRQRLVDTLAFLPEKTEADIVDLNDDDVVKGYDGDWYLKGHAPVPTSEWLVEHYKGMIQAWMDDEAVNLGYDNLLTACTYMNTGVPKFDAEGEGFRQWRSAVWATGYQLIDEVLSGQRDIPEDDADVIALLPTLNIVYPEEVNVGEVDE